MFSKTDVEAYFNGEKSESLFFMIAGLVALVSAILLFFVLKHAWAKGASLPVFLVGLIMAVVGYNVFSRSDAQRKDIVYKMDMDTEALTLQEIPRMEQVMVNFAYYRYTEIFLLATGIILFLVFRTKINGQWWTGLGLSLAFMAAVMLIADGFAERRGRTYLEGLKQYAK
jgi:hypothetical protein